MDGSNAGLTAEENYLKIIQIILQTSYGNNPSGLHGGAGGNVRGPYNLLPGRVIKMIEVSCLNT